MTVRRLRQITAAINRRVYFKERQQRQLVSWQTRQISSFIAAGYQVEGDNPAIAAAQSLAFDDIEHAQLEDAKKYMADHPVIRENKAGSYERFMGSMGNKSRWEP